DQRRAGGREVQRRDASRDWWRERKSQCAGDHRHHLTGVPVRVGRRDVLPWRPGDRTEQGIHPPHADICGGKGVEGVRLSIRLLRRHRWPRHHVADFRRRTAAGFLRIPDRRRALQVTVPLLARSPGPAAQRADAVANLAGVTKRYGTITALDDVDLAI